MCIVIEWTGSMWTGRRITIALAEQMLFLSDQLRFKPKSSEQHLCSSSPSKSFEITDIFPKPWLSCLDSLWAVLNAELGIEFESRSEWAVAHFLFTFATDNIYNKYVLFIIATTSCILYRVPQWQWKIQSIIFWTPLKTLFFQSVSRVNCNALFLLSDLPKWENGWFPNLGGMWSEGFLISRISSWILSAGRKVCIPSVLLLLFFLSLLRKSPDSTLSFFFIFQLTISPNSLNPGKNVELNHSLLAIGEKFMDFLLFVKISPRNWNYDNRAEEEEEEGKWAKWKKKI